MDVELRSSEKSEKLRYSASSSKQTQGPHFILYIRLSLSLSHCMLLHLPPNSCIKVQSLCVIRSTTSSLFMEHKLVLQGDWFCLLLCFANCSSSGWWVYPHASSFYVPLYSLYHQIYYAASAVFSYAVGFVHLICLFVLAKPK